MADWLQEAALSADHLPDTLAADPQGVIANQIAYAAMAALIDIAVSLRKSAGLPLPGEVQ